MKKVKLLIEECPNKIIIRILDEKNIQQSYISIENTVENSAVVDADKNNLKNDSFEIITKENPIYKNFL